MIKTSQ